ncbi:hypothetical protein AAF712_015080 [Marasmius tenuissimus]|uniref:DUF6534 domain-containing protein n=1 Tax=Marasmius tenuissimus TaxID=585030 RepID=A0ABR2Z9J1_9AGAR
METGSFTALVATLDLIIFLIYPNSDYHVTLTLALAKLYANSLLVALNIRMKIPGSRGYKEPNVVLFEDRTVPIQFNSQAFRTDHGHGLDSRLERRFGQRSATPTETQIMVTEEVWSDRITNADLGIDDVRLSELV